MIRTPVVALILFVFWDFPIFGITFTVTTSEDTVANDGLLSLREAIQASNDESGKDVIVMSDTLDEGITLGGTALTISDSVEIDGTYFPPPVIGKEKNAKIVFSAPIAVDANNQSRVFIIDGGVSSVEIRNMFVLRGREISTNGGGMTIGKEATVTLNNVTVRDCRVFDDGAGIWSDRSNLTLVNCRVEDNFAGDPLQFGANGGGITVAGGVLTLINCEISGNGAIGSGSEGGDGVCIDDATGNFTDTIISENGGSTSIGGGIRLLADSVLNVTRGEVIGNQGRDGAGIHAGGSSEVSLAGTVIAENTATASGGGYYGFANLEATGIHVLRNAALADGPDDGGGGFYNRGTATVRSSTFESNIQRGINPKGGGAIDNRGIFTLSDSIVLNNESPDGGDGGGISNSGAGELMIVNSRIHGNRAATFGGGVYVFEGIVRMLAGEISDNTAGNRGGGVFVSRDGLFEATGTRFRTNWMPSIGSDAGGGGLYNNGDTVINDCTFESNVSMSFFGGPGDPGGGGGIFNDRNLQITDSLVTRNRVPTGKFSLGGGILNFGELLISGGEISHNTAEVGAGLSVWSGTATLHEVIIDSNTAGFSGGGIRVERGSRFIMNGGSVIENSAEVGGGVVINGDPDVPDGGIFANVNGTFISENVVTGSDEAFRGGGGIVNLGTLRLANAIVKGNTVETFGERSGGGGIFNSFVLSATDCLISGNAAVVGQLKGGGLYNDRKGRVMLFRSQIHDNAGKDGGGIFNLGTIHFKSTHISENRALDHGGGIFNGSGTVIVDASTLSGNFSQMGDGGGIHSASGITRLINSTLSGNRSFIGSGGGVASKNQETIVELIHTTVADNHAGTSGGGIHLSAGAVQMGNSILANNTADVSSPNLFGTLTSLDFNLISDTSNGTLAGPIANSLLNVDPVLGPLADNGGPTLTHNLLAGSPAIDSASLGITNGNGLTLDQRGFNRVSNIASIPDVDGGVDIGAVEIIGLEIEDELAFENAGEIQFNVSLSNSPPAGQLVRVEVSTADVPGGASAGEDYAPIMNEVVTFTSAGPFLQSVAVVINDDSEFESNEDFEVRLSNAFGAAILGGTATGTIINDDVEPVSTPTPTRTPMLQPSVTITPAPEATHTRNYDVQPEPTDGIVDARDLIEWYARIKSGSPEEETFFDFARFWAPE